MKFLSLKCDCCKKTFNPKTKRSFGYTYDRLGKEVIFCCDRCRIIVVASIQAAKHFDETMLLED
jgi:hypothetical protein|nr:hypothetical protein [uncultured Mediterranean phage uvMED]